MSIPATLPKTIRAWAIDAYGGSEQMRLRELRVPTPKPHDVLIRMHYAEVGDWDRMRVCSGKGHDYPFGIGSIETKNRRH